MVAKHSDQMETIELQISQAAKKEEVVEMKKTMFKPLQEKQDQIDDRLKRLERGGNFSGQRGGAGGLVTESHQGSASLAGGGKCGTCCVWCHLMQ